jgi:uncharacterized protein YbaP (TraB family)
MVPALAAAAGDPPPASLASASAATTAAACPSSAAATVPPEGWAAAARHAPDRGLLWRIDRDGHSSWLYGTIHLGRAEWMLPGPVVREALEQSDTIALELDPLDTASMQPLLRPVDPALAARLLDGKRAQRLARQSAAACLPAGALARLQPILQVTTLGGLAARADGLYPDFGIDNLLATIARRSHKPVVALENAADQLRLLKGESESEEAEQIDQALDELESGRLRAQLNELADVWARSDGSRLTHYADWCDCMRTPAEREQMKRLLDARNPGLADGIERLHASGQRVFGAVGALHMIGPRGLPALLAARGFTITAMLPAGQGAAPPQR